MKHFFKVISVAMLFVSHTGSGLFASEEDGVKKLYSQAISDWDKGI